MTSRFVRPFAVAALWLVAMTAVVPVSAVTLPDFTELVKDQHRAVVNISAIHNPAQNPAQGGGPSRDEPWRRFFGPDRRPHHHTSLGSGFIISADGYVLTNGHVIADAERIVVRLYDRRQYDAKVIGVDERSDVALLKIDAADLPHVRIGDPGELEVGSWVLAIGSPFGFEHSATAGIISAKDRSLPDQSYVPFLQTDVAINPGNSGGPLFNVEGEVIGINALILSRTGGFMGVSFAVPIDLAMDVADQLRAGGEVTRGWLGVVVQEVTGDLAESFDMERTRGALVARVLDGSPAQQAGLRAGDVILAFNGREVSGHAALPAMVGSTGVGSMVQLTILRAGARRALPVRIGRLPSRDALAQRFGPGDSRPEPAGGRLGLAVGPVDEQTRRRLDLDPGGVQVMAPPTGAAAAAGLRRGDVLVRLNAHPIQGVDDFREQVTSLSAGSTVALLVQRRGGAHFFAIPVPESSPGSSPEPAPGREAE